MWFVGVFKIKVIRAKECKCERFLSGMRAAVIFWGVSLCLSLMAGENSSLYIGDCIQ